MNICSKCQHENEDYLENCEKCGQYLPNEEDLLKIQSFKWWFVIIVIFCFIMFFALPR